MRKTIVAASAALVLLALGACSDRHVKDGADRHDGDRKEVYTGVLPAADTDGIRYTLHLDYDDDHNYTDGDYHLVESYLVPDSTARMNYSDSVSYKTKGDFYVEKDASGKKYLKLVPDRGQAGAETLYWLVTSDSTLELTDANLQQAEPSGLNYTIKLVK